MPDIVLEQALFHRDAGGPRLLTRSAGFPDEWLPLAEAICTGFGERPAGVRCPVCVFARPFGNRHVTVVQAADDPGQPSTLGFRFLVVARDAYAHWIGDPFILADRFPPDWSARRDLPSLSWPAEPLPPRTVAQIQSVLQRTDGPTLLGGVQALVDGSRLVFERSEPDTSLLRSLWMLLPTSNRSELWPASFAFGNALGFDAVVVPQMNGEDYPGYLNGRDADGYPEGRYELNLQIAAEAGDQRELDMLFARRSRQQMLRLGLVLLVAITLMMIVMSVLSPRPPAAKQGPPKQQAIQADKPDPGK